MRMKVINNLCKKFVKQIMMVTTDMPGEVKRDCAESYEVISDTCTVLFWLSMILKPFLGDTINLSTSPVLC